MYIYNIQRIIILIIILFYSYYIVDSFVINNKSLYDVFNSWNISSS